ALGVVAHEQADETAVGGCDRQVAEVLLAHPLDHRRKPCAGPDRARAGSHRRFDALARLALERGSAEAAEHDPLIVDDEAGVPAPVTDAPANLIEVLLEPAGGDVGAYVRACTRRAAAPALE